MEINGSVVLLVDDDRNVLVALARLMDACGVRLVKKAENGIKALEIINTGLNPDFVITDYSMPVMDGVDLTKRIRAINQKLPIVMLTANDHVSERRAAEQAGVSAYLLKPFNLNDLLEIIARL